MKLMQTIVLVPGQQSATGAEPLTFTERFQPVTPRVAETVPGPAIDWPELDTVRASLDEDDDCIWKQSAFR